MANFDFQARGRAAQNALALRHVSAGLPTIVKMGDSRQAAGGGIDSGSQDLKNTNWREPFNVANGLLGRRFFQLANFGHSGDTSAQMLAYLSAALAYNADFYQIQIGTNDFSQGVTDAAVFANVKMALDVITGRGSRAILFTESGGGAYGGNATNKGYVFRYNDRLRQYAASNPGIILFDYMTTQMNPTSTALAAKTGYWYDTQHPNNLGGYAAGKALAAILAPLIPVSFRNVTTSPSDIYANGTAQLIDNPLFLTTTGGTAGAGITGSVPTGLTIACSGSTTATVSTATALNGIGNDLIITPNFAAVGDTVSCTFNSILGRCTTGDVVTFGCEGQLASPSKVGAISCQNQVGNYGLMFDGMEANFKSALVDPFTATFQTKPYTVGTVTESFMAPGMTIVCNATGAGDTVYFRMPFARKALL